MGLFEIKLYIRNQQNLQDLVERLRDEVNRITPAVIRYEQKEYVSRFAYSQETGGWHFEHLI